MFSTPRRFSSHGALVTSWAPVTLSVVLIMGCVTDEDCAKTSTCLPEPGAAGGNTGTHEAGAEAGDIVLDDGVDADVMAASAGSSDTPSANEEAVVVGQARDDELTKPVWRDAGSTALEAGSETDAGQAQLDAFDASALEIDAGITQLADSGHVADGGLPQHDADATASPLPNVVSFSVGHDFACAIREDASLWCWGANGHGQLGSGTQGGYSTVPVKTLSNPGWTLVSARDDHACGINEGRLFCWGRNLNGALGIGTSGDEASATIPVRVGEASDWISISAGVRHTCGIRAGGLLYCWGGRGGTNTLDLVTRRVGSATGWRLVTAGASDTCAVRDDELYCWGHNLMDRLGLGEGLPEEIEEPLLVRNDVSWTSITSDNGVYCGTSEVGELYCWGGFLWLDGVDTKNGPAFASATADWRSVSVGSESFGCGLKENGEIWCFGDSAHGQRGPGDHAEETLTRTLSGPWDDMRAGKAFGCALQGGELHCWGSHVNGKLGVGENGTVVRSIVPRRVTDTNDWTHVSTGQMVTCGIRNGDAYCWGDHRENYGLNYPAEPTRITTGATWTSLNVGEPAIVGTESRRFVWWRFDPRSGTNDGPAGLTHLPVTEDWLQDVKSVASSRATHGATCAIASPADSLYCYGDHNGYGQLGLGDDSTPMTPTRVGASTSWQAVSPGWVSSCGIDDGELYCWGSNLYGQMGLGTDALDRVFLEPTRVGSSSGWSDVSLGDFHACGVESGRLRCWGTEYLGRTGLGGAEGEIYPDPTSPTQYTDWSSVSVGPNHGCAIRAQGSLYCWGSNSFFQLGLSADTGSVVPIPTQVNTDSDWASVSTSLIHTCATKHDGSLWCWGTNAFGQLGLGPSWSDTPLPVNWEEQ